METMRQWIHHLWVDPISAEEKFVATMVIGWPLALIIGVGKMIFDWWYENYYDR